MTVTFVKQPMLKIYPNLHYLDMLEAIVLKHVPDRYFTLKLS